MIRTNSRYEIDYIIRDAADVYDKYRDYAGSDKKAIGLLLSTLIGTKNPNGNEYLIRDADDTYMKYKDYAGSDERAMGLVLAAIMLKQYDFFK